MNDTNVTVLAGRLTKDADLQYTTSGTAISKMSLACNESKKKNEEWEDEVSYFDLELWGVVAEVLNEKLKKGKQIVITGKLKQERWEREGNNRSKVKVIVKTIQLL